MSKKPELKLADFDSQKHAPKNLGEQINDLYFIIYVLSKALEKNIKVDTLNLNKTLFQLKLNLAIDNNIDFLMTDFYTLKKGPFNKELAYDYVQILEKGGFVVEEDNKISIKSKGLELYDLLESYLEREYPDDAQKISSLTLKYVNRYKNHDKAIEDTHDLMVQDGNKVVSVDTLAEKIKSGETKYPYRVSRAKYLEPNVEMDKKIMVSDKLVNIYMDREDVGEELGCDNLEDIIKHARKKLH